MVSVGRGIKFVTIMGTFLIVALFFAPDIHKRPLGELTLQDLAITAIFCLFGYGLFRLSVAPMADTSAVNWARGGFIFGLLVAVGSVFALVWLNAPQETALPQSAARPKQAPVTNEIQPNGLTKETNDYLRDLAKQPKRP